MGDQMPNVTINGQPVETRLPDVAAAQTADQLLPLIELAEPESHQLQAAAQAARASSWRQRCNECLASQNLQNPCHRLDVLYYWEGLWGVHSGIEGASFRRKALQQMGSAN